MKYVADPSVCLCAEPPSDEPQRLKPSLTPDSIAAVNRCATQKL